MKVLICGDRHWTDYGAILDAVKRLKAACGSDITIIQGEAPGADIMAKKAAIECGLACKSYPADWNQYGKSAGPRRNQQMLDENPDIEMVIGFHPNIQASRGTKDMLNRARRARIKTYLFSG